MTYDADKKNRLGPGVAAALIILGVLALGYQMLGSRTDAVVTQKSAYFTSDDGKTFFKDDINKIFPFEHGGRKAYRADVFKCPDGREFVGLVYQLTDGGKREMEAYLKARPRDADGSMRKGIEERGMLVKKPGGDEKSWTSGDETTVEKMRAAMKCPPPSNAPATIVVP